MAQKQNSPSKLSADLPIKDQSSSEKDAPVPQNIHSLLKEYDLLAVNHLITSYNKELTGIIMNEDEGMNVCLQISAFLAALEGSSSILIVTSWNVPWHFYLEKYANFRVVRLTLALTTEDIQNLIQEYPRIAFVVEDNCLLRINDVETLEFSVTIVEDFEKLASKSLPNKINAKFYIGTTCHNFYIEWDQNLLYKMMKFACRDREVSLQTFLASDKTSFDTFRNNYRFWWYRLAWDYCKTFAKPTAEDLESYKNKMRKYDREVLRERYPKNEALSPTKLARKRRKEEQTSLDDEAIGVASGVAIPLPAPPGPSEEQVPKKKDELVAVRMNELKIVSGIRHNFEKSPEPAKKIVKSPISEADNHSLIRSYLNSPPISSRSAQACSPPQQEAAPVAEKEEKLSDLLKEADDVLQDK